MQYAVDEGQDAHGQRHLGALFQLAALVLLHPQASLGHLFVLFFQEVIQLMVLFLFLVQVVEQPEQAQQQHDGTHDGQYHPVQLVDGMVQNASPRLQLTVLARLFL